MLMSKRMAKAKKSKTSSKSPQLDSVYFLKLIMFFMIGSFWLHISWSGHTLPLPLGIVIGAWFASHEHFRVDRKIEYAILVISMFLSYFLSPRFEIVF